MADEKKSGGGFGCGAVLVLILLVGVTQCDRSEGGGSPSNVRPGTTAAVSMWGDKYDVSVKARIDRLAQQVDCSGLQAEFDQADENDDITRARTGTGTADLMRYIDDKLRDAGCY